MESKQPLVLVLDDDASMRHAIQRLLLAGGYRVLSFASAEELGAAGCAHSADCMVLDMRLPGQSGHHFYASLSQPRPPALFVTAHDSLASRRMALGAGGSAFLAKPFDGAALLDWVALATRAEPTPPPA